ncbi:hypothetical protein V2J09_020071 [Rumex salicifolius]
MAVSPLNPNSRSISLPPRPHPIYPEFDEHLYRLRSSSFTSTPSTSLLIADRLAALIDLYDCVDGLLMLPQNQANLSKDCLSDSIDSILDGSLKLLDVCSTSRDALLDIKEHVQGIQSVLRRRFGDELGFIDEVSEYLGAIKGVKKVVKKCLDDVRSLPKGSKAHMRMFDVLREVEGVTSEVFESLLCYIGGIEMKSRKGSWALVAKILVTMACEAEEASPRNEFDDVDVVVGLFFGQRKRNGVNVSRLRGKMMKLENVIQDFDELLECLFRRLVKTRATLLNILNSTLIMLGIVKMGSGDMWLSKMKLDCKRNYTLVSRWIPVLSNIKETKFAGERVCTYFGSCKLNKSSYELYNESGRRQF